MLTMLSAYDISALIVRRHGEKHTETQRKSVSNNKQPKWKKKKNEIQSFRPSVTVCTRSKSATLDKVNQKERKKSSKQTNKTK